MCGFTGDGKLFALGCPNCGYSGVTGMSSTVDRSAAAQSETYDVDEVEGARKRSKQPYTPRTGSETPTWVFPLAILILIGAFAALVIVYLSL